MIDALNDGAVNQYIDGIVKQAGKIDILLDAAGPRAREYSNGKTAVELKQRLSAANERDNLVTKSGALDKL